MGAPSDPVKTVLLLILVLGLDPLVAIIAIGLSAMFARKSTILENVIVQSIGANSSHVVSGAVFTIPALYMLASEAGSSAARAPQPTSAIRAATSRPPAS